MKIEIIKEQKFDENPWYGLYVDDLFIVGSFTLDIVERKYEKIKNTPNFKINTKEILKSEEFGLSLEANKEKI